MSSQPILLPLELLALCLLHLPGSPKPARGVALGDKPSQPLSLHAVLLVYLFMWVASRYVKHENLGETMARRPSLWQFNFYSLSRSSFDCSPAAVLVSPRRVGVLILSSCYMAFKIVALEQRLNSLVSNGEHLRNEWAPGVTDCCEVFFFVCVCVWVHLCHNSVANSCRRNTLSHRTQNDINAEIYGELSTNLFKLEKVCLRFTAQLLWPLELISVYEEMFVFICFRLGLGFIDMLC